MLQPDGQAWLLELVRDNASSVVVRVWESDDVFADAPLDEGFPQIEEGEVIFQATFDGDSANFDWKRHGVVLGDRIIDVTEDDLGTKVSGMVWELAPRVVFAGAAPSGD